MKTITLMALAMCLNALSAVAQVTAKIEYPHRGDYEDQVVATLGERGLIVYSFAKKADNGKRYFKTEYLSTELKPLFTDSTLIDEDLYFYSCTFDNDVNYTVLRARSGAFSVFAFNTRDHKTKVTDSEYTRKGSMRDLIIHDGKLVFSSTQKRLERIGIVDLNTGESRFADVHIPGVKDRKVFILQNTILDNIIYAVVKGDRELYLARIDFNGTQLGITNLTTEIDQNLLSASLSKANDKYFVTGTYTKSKKGGAEGIYFAQLEDWKFKKQRFVNFLDLKNFTEYMSDRRKARVERKKEKAEKAGKEYSLKYNMASHGIMTDGKDYFYLGEAFYPTYVTYWAGTVMITQFNGYAYTHAVLAKFDADCNLLWDNCFEMRPRQKPMYVKRFISAGIKQNDVDLVYADDKMLVSKLFNNKTGEVAQERKSEMIETDNEDEDIKKMRYSGTLHWYDKNFIVYGRQIIKNHSTGERRKVFSITKYTIK